MRYFFSVYSPKRIEARRLRDALSSSFQIPLDEVEYLEIPKAQNSKKDMIKRIEEILKNFPQNTETLNKKRIEYEKRHKKIVAEQNRIDISSEFKFEISINFDTTVYKIEIWGNPDENGIDYSEIELTRKIAANLGEPIIGRLPTYGQNAIFYLKCYPDGREERVEWPEED